jgi:membrane protease YdiL (CAAX protease family)
MAKKGSPPQSSNSSEPIYRVWAWILLAWSLYRYFIRMPELADEFIFKPLVFVVPVIWYVLKKERRPLSSVGLTTKNLFKSIYIGLGFGAIFALEGFLAHVLKYGRVEVSPIAAFEQYGFFLLILSLATAFSEELLSRGFVFNRLYEKTGNLTRAALIGAVLFLCLHVPILVTINKLTGMTLVLFFVTDFILAVANSMLFAMTGSLVAPILVHIFWNMTVALYL